ncbi:MAG: CopG family antitoxin [Geminicoccaceae bacterium]
MTKKVPSFKTDEEAEAFLEQDLTDYLDLNNFEKANFEFLPKTERVNLRFSAPLLEAVRAKAKRVGISYQKYIRQVVEESLAKGSNPPR